MTFSETNQYLSGDNRSMSARVCSDDAADKQLVHNNIKLVLGYDTKGESLPIPLADDSISTETPLPIPCPHRGDGGTDWADRSLRIGYHACKGGGIYPRSRESAVIEYSDEPLTSNIPGPQGEAHHQGRRVRHHFRDRRGEGSILSLTRSTNQSVSSIVTICDQSTAGTD